MSDIKDKIAERWGQGDYGVVVDNSNLNPFGDLTAITPEEMESLREQFQGWFDDLEIGNTEIKVITDPTEVEEILEQMFGMYDDDNKPFVIELPPFEDEEDDDA